MATTPRDEEPGFETDVNELPQTDKGSEDSLEENPRTSEQDAADLEDAQKDGAEERGEGGYH
ncbi:hypothetical protein [Sphingomonas sp. R86520]|uniref:hypothetical protein n=1 Tax=Sphingomonas sp. R86520 TaxID=3093859 RepID=UPI0036D368A7